ncbi:DNRLRE domain-containing protein [Kribbella deserti]|uniref:DNRLRE domain-containing protein n=1 Tax=Kribbella deserti TaxID=1926257 RepID=A0ABV6QJH3_9ACTN
MAVLAALALAGALTGYGASEPVRAGPVTEATTADPPRTAAEMAAESGQQVLIPEKTTESSQTFANADGSFTLNQSTVPVRTKKDGAWVHLDATLERGGDGIIRPRATSIDMAFSGGGTGPLVTVVDDGAQLALSWPGTLPTPTVEGDRITYPNVYPDVDLLVTASTVSFTQVLVVKTPTAARLPQLRTLELPISAPGLTLRRSVGGGIDAVDKVGHAVFTSPKPTMWDSRGSGKVEPQEADRTEAPFEGDSVAAMPVEVTQATVTLTPSIALRDDPKTRYPLHIDPPFSGYRSGQAMINQHYPDTVTWNWTDTEGVGYQEFEPWSRKRLFFQFHVGHIAGAVIHGAKFSAYETWAGSCTPTEVQAWKTARFDATTTWNNGSGSSMWLERQSSVTAALGRNECTPNGGWLTFPVTDAVSERVGQQSNYVYLGLRAGDESNQFAWKRFKPEAQLSIIYNHPPSITKRSMAKPAAGCETTLSEFAVTGATNPLPAIEMSDQDAGQSLTAEFELWHVETNKRVWLASSAAQRVTGDFVPDRAFSNITPGHVYGWRARADDGMNASPWTSFCYFLVDTTKPGIPNIEFVTKPPYRSGSPITVRFTANSFDVVGYKYSISTDEVGNEILHGTSPTMTFTPQTFGYVSIRARSVDRAGHTSAEMALETILLDETGASGRWMIEEGSGTILADSSGRNRPLNTTAGVSWAHGNKWYVEKPDWAVVLNGSAGTAPSTALDIVDTSKNFSVATHVRVGSKSARQTAVSEDRPGRSSFTLGVWQQQNLDSDDSRKVIWAFTVVKPDGTEAVAKSPALPYRPQDWVHISGRYSENTRAISICVDTHCYPEIKIGTTPSDGNLPFRIGRGIEAGAASHYWLGLIDDVHLFPGFIAPATVGMLANGGNPL